MARDIDIDGLAVPFIVGMAVGLALGRTALDSLPLGVVVGLVLVVVLAALRRRLVP
jgi:hypothetical protein